MWIEFLDSIDWTLAWVPKFRLENTPLKVRAPLWGWFHHVRIYIILVGGECSSSNDLRNSLDVMKDRQQFLLSQPHFHLLDVFLLLRFIWSTWATLRAVISLQRIKKSQGWLQLGWKAKLGKKGTWSFFSSLGGQTVVSEGLLGCDQGWLKEMEPVDFFHVSGLWKQLWFTHTVKLCSLSCSSSVLL